jgi:acetyltransferase-like isoleucine patch superfamily enzyme
MRRIIVQVLQYLAQRRLQRNNRNIAIDPAAKVDCRRIRFHAGSTLQIGAGSLVRANIVSQRDGVSVVIGRNSSIGEGSTIDCAGQIEVGDDVLVASRCYIFDHNSHAIGWRHRKQDVQDWIQGLKDWSHVTVKPVKIGNKSWIGLNVIVLKGVEIGEGAVVAAGSVVVKSVPPWTVVAGNPAKVIREIPDVDR